MDRRLPPLGATLHLILTGALRHTGASVLEVLLAAEKSEPVSYDDSVPRELGELANAATAHDPAKRPPDALAFRTAITTHLDHAASLELVRDGERRLDRLLGRGPQEGEPAPTRSAARLGTEARFAFETALERWPENPQAKDGLARCLRAAIESEIARENLAGALELRAEMRDVPEELVLRLADLEARLAARARSESELARLQDEASLDTGRRERAVMLFVVLAVVFTGLLSTTLFVSEASMTSLLFTLAPPVVGLGVLGVTAFWLRRAVLANQAGRRVVLLIAFAMLYILFHRATTALAHPSVAAAEVRSELVILSVLGAAAGTFRSPRAFVVAILPMIGAIAVFVVGSPSMVFNATAIATLGAMLIELRKPPKVLS